MKNSILFRHLLFVAVTSLVTTLVYVTPYFIDNPVDDWESWVTIVAYWLVIFVVNMLIVGCMSAVRSVFAVLFPVYALIGAVQAYFRLFAGATFTPMIIDAVLHNDYQTSMDLVTLPLCAFVAVNIFFAVAVVWLRLHRVGVSCWPMLAVCPLLLVGFLTMHGRVYSGCAERFPINVYHSTRLYYQSMKSIGERVMVDSIVKVSDADNLDVVLVLGESLRADHLSLNGYHRPTTPGLQSRSNIISLRRIYTNYTYTNVSLPHILTRADSTDGDIAYRETSIINVFRKAGFYTTWIGNQDSGETYIDFMNEADKLIYVHPEKSVFVFDEWFDRDILPIFDQVIAQSTRRQFVVIHTIGSHWFYNIHVPSDCQMFSPIVHTREVKRNEPNEVVNSYDNTIVATDQFLCSLLDKLGNRNAIAIFLSDHGECLGENNEWLHANENNAIRNTACFVWYSNCYYDAHKSLIDTLSQRTDSTYLTDFLYHSLQSAAGIRTQFYKSALDIFQ